MTCSRTCVSFCFLLFAVISIYSHLICAVKVLHFIKGDCDVYRYTMYENDKYEIEWNGEEITETYCSLHFKSGGGIFDGLDVCAKVTEFRIDCSQSLVFYYVNEQRSDCYTSMPITEYCDSNFLVKIDPYRNPIERKTNSRVRVSIYTKKDDSSSSSSSGISTATIIAISIVPTILIIICIICVALAKSRQQQSNRPYQPTGGVAVLRNDGTVIVTPGSNVPQPAANQYGGAGDGLNQGQYMHNQQQQQYNYGPQQTNYGHPQTNYGPPQQSYNSHNQQNYGCQQQYFDARPQQSQSKYSNQPPPSYEDCT